MIRDVLQDMTTTKDGESYDIARVVITANAVALLPIMFAGVGLYIYGYFISKPFPIQDFFDAVLKYSEGVGTLLFTGSAAIFFKRQTEPDGTINDVTEFTRGAQSPKAEVNIVNEK